MGGNTFSVRLNGEGISGDGVEREQVSAVERKPEEERIWLLKEGFLSENTSTTE